MKKTSVRISSKGNEIKVVGMGMVRMFRIGNEARPAGPADIRDFKKDLKECYRNPGTNLVCHHAVQVQVIGCEEANMALQLFDRGLLTKAEIKRKLKV